MKEYFLEAFKIMKSDIKLLLVLALMPSIMLISGITTFLGIIMLLFLIPVVYGYFTETILGEPHTSFVEIFKRHWLNFYSVVIILSFPPLLLRALLNRIIGVVTSSSIHLVISLAISIFSIYIYPLLFIKRKRMLAIVGGVAGLLGNFRKNLPLVLLTLITPAVIALCFPLFKFFGRTHTLLRIILLSFIGLLRTLIGFTVFITASLILVKAGNWPKSKGAV